LPSGSKAGHDVQLQLHPCWLSFQRPDWKTNDGRWLSVDFTFAGWRHRHNLTIAPAVVAGQVDDRPPIE
jgi:hypothetical protein